MRINNLIETINTNFDLYDFLSHKYENYNSYEGVKLNSFFFDLSLDTNILKEYRRKINWNKVSLDLPLTEELIEEFFEELYSTGVLTKNGIEKGCLFSQNTKINWTESLIDKYKNYLHWPSILKNPSIPWDQFLIDKYLPKEKGKNLDWLNLSSNPGIKWDEHLITKYYSFLYINCLIDYSEIFWDTKLLNTALQNIEFENQKLYLSYFSKITNVKWDFDTIFSYPNSYSSWLGNVISNKTIEINFDIIRKYINQIDKNMFAIIQESNDLYWNTELIKEFSSHINFDILSKSKNVDWNSDLIDSFKDFLNFNILSENYSVPISNELMKKYSERWDFKRLSRRGNNCWDIDSIEEFIERIDLDEIIKISRIEFSAQFIENNKNKFTWNGRWKKIGRDNETYCPSIISQQRHLSISVQTLSEMATKWGVGCSSWSGRDESMEWHCFSNNSNLTPEHLSNFKDFLSWEVLSKNTDLHISKEILVLYAEKWDYSEILKRNDIDWDIETFCKISHHLNWDILKGNENKIMEILRLEENTILNYFAYIYNYNKPFHRETFASYSYELNERSIRTSKIAEICSKAINESNLLKLNDYFQLWNWLKKYINFYYENTDLTSNLKRSPKNDRVDTNTDSIIAFISVYKRNKKIFDEIYKERGLK